MQAPNFSIALVYDVRNMHNIFYIICTYSNIDHSQDVVSKHAVET